MKTEEDEGQVKLRIASHNEIFEEEGSFKVSMKNNMLINEFH